MIKNFRMLAPMLLFVLFPKISEATFITIQTDNRVSVEKDAAKVHVEVTNKGDESAYNIRISAEIDGKAQSGPLQEILDVNKRYSLDLSSSLGFKKPGKYPVVITVDYTDQNQYPFTAIAIGYVDYRERVVGRVVGEMGVTPITLSGRVKVKVKNLEQVENKIGVRLVLPKEFITQNSRKDVAVQPGKEEAVDFDITNVSSIQGSQYQIYAILEYEDARYHYANAISGAIQVEEKKSLLKVYKTPLIAFAVILVIVAVYLNLRRRSGG